MTAAPAPTYPYGPYGQYQSDDITNFTKGSTLADDVTNRSNRRIGIRGSRARPGEERDHGDKKQRRKAETQEGLPCAAIASCARGTPIAKLSGPPAVLPLSQSLIPNP